MKNPIRLSEGTINDSDYINFLNLFSEFNYEETKKNFEFRYILNDPALEQLKNKYDYLDQVIPGKEFRTMVQLMIWVNTHLIGDGMCVPPTKVDADYILDKTQKENLSSNCYMHAIVLNEIYLSMGFASRMVRCMPIDLSFNDCHCMTEVYSNEYQKWIAFDAANRAYYVNKKMIPLNLFELRKNISCGFPVIVPMMNRNENAKLLQYLMKNLIRFESYQISQCKQEYLQNDKVMLHFQSSNFPISDKLVKYPEIGISILHLHTSNPNQYWKKP